jgi:predicted peroxiredoxin
MTKHPRSTIVLTAGLLVAGIGYMAYSARAEEQAGRKGAMVINLTSGKEDVHAVNMALELAGHALDDGREVVVFLNVRAPELGSKDLPATWGLAGKPPISEMMSKLMKRGAVFLCCPSCMQVLGVKEADLADGVKLASKESLFGALGDGAAVFSY